MWFKQVPCDYCYRLLTYKSIDKCYVAVRYKNKFALNSDTSFQTYLAYHEQFPIHFAAFNNSKPAGKLYAYDPIDDDFQFRNRMMFCNNDCAYQHSRNTTEVLFYFDKTLNANRAIVQEMQLINNALGAPINKGLSTNIKQSLGITFQEEDLTRYNEAVEPFRSLKNKDISIVPFETSYAEEFRALLTEDGFMSDFDGYYNEKNFAADYTIRLASDQIAFYKQLEKRRLGAMWRIVVNDQTIGMIRINYKDKWMLEYGLFKKFRNKGYMSSVLKMVLAWCKKNGLENLYAVTEKHNIASLKLLRKFTSDVLPMTDTNGDGTTRPTIGFILKM